MLPALRHVENWIFDLDNCLYPASCDLFALIDQRMTDFVEQRFGLDREAARRLQKSYFHEHGTTLSGLMATREIDPQEFLDFVHDIDLARISADPDLVALIDRLPGRKFVFTNGDESYARRVLDKIGFANAWDGLHDIHAMAYVPKPDPRAYRLLCDRHDIDPARALFAEDMARNLKPAKVLGMVTVWVDNGSEQANADADPDHIDFHTHDIGAWLAQATTGTS
ncbi:MAG TPA: pyrimidine 5'-nucleotidase [Allosphingosinicella sp.]|jgi:putative hydrolase of the HAD superfamily